MKLELCDVEKSFGDKRVLQGVSFTVQSGRAFGLLGRNGAGKTTCIRILMQVFGADGGQVLLNGEPLSRSRATFGYLPEERGLYPKKRVAEQLAYFAELKGLPHKAAVAAVANWLARLGMSDAANKRLDTLSKGNQQKVQLVTALAHNPDVVILDEPFSGLDPVNALLLKEVVQEQIAQDKLVLFSSHQMNTIEEFCDSIAILNGGRAVLCGDLREIKRGYPRDRLAVTTEDPAPLLRDFGDAATKTRRGEVILRLDDPGEKQAVMRRLAEQYDIDGVRVLEPTLSDIFVEYAGEEA